MREYIMAIMVFQALRLPISHNNIFSKYFIVHFLLADGYLFISFAPPKETNQRKGVPK